MTDLNRSTTSVLVSYVCGTLNTGVTDADDDSNSTDKTDRDSARVMSAHARLHKYINVTPTCWLWIGTVYTHKGKVSYGQFWFRGVRMGAHRASYLIHVGEIPVGLDCMHSCDVKLCVNPAHLSPGTRSQNVLDAFKSNPGVCAGENNGRARLTWDDVHAIRVARKLGASQGALSRQYGVHQVQISHIVRGTRWPESKCPVHAAPAEVAA